MLPEAENILATFPSSPGTHAHGGAAWGGLVWQSEHGRSLIIEFECEGTFRRTIPNPVAGRVNSDTGVGDLAYDPNTNTFWQSNLTSTIYNLDINGNLVDSISTGRQIVGLTVDPTTNTLWGGASGTATQYDLATGNQLSTIPVPGLDWQSLAFDGTNLWVHEWANTRVWQVDPTDGTVQQTFVVGVGLGRGLAHDTQDLWIFDETTDQITEVDDGVGPSGPPCFRGP